MRNPWVSARRRVAGRAVAMNQVEYQASFWFPVPPPQIWTIIERFDLFEFGWAWLAGFRAHDGGLVTGNVLHGTVIPPVPNRQRLDVRLQQCDRPRLIEAAIDGDVRGRRCCGWTPQAAARGPR
jgi:hypothetical protein